MLNGNDKCANLLTKRPHNFEHGYIRREGDGITPQTYPASMVIFFIYALATSLSFMEADMRGILVN
jgi:hypothetical protein